MKSISVIIPAHNEEHYLPLCLKAIRVAANSISLPVQCVVVLNRCTDRTEQIAQEYGATLVHENAKNLSIIRNAGAALATGDILVTIDADSLMQPLTLHEMLEKLSTEKFIGGGAGVLPERWSLGICCSIAAVVPFLAVHGVSFCMFWCLKEDFETLGGFNPAFVTIEDVDFAKRLKALGKSRGLKYGTVWKHPVITSCRKFDQFGDWYLVKNPHFVRRVFKGTDQDAGNSFWYDARS